MIRRRQPEQKEQLRRLILQEASGLFLESGYSHFSMRKLAERTGCSPATLYLYFRDKDDLLFTVVDDAFVRFKRELAEAAAGSEDPWERLGRLSEAYIRFGLDYPVHYQLMFMWRIDYLTGSRKGDPKPRMEAFQVLADAVRYAIDRSAMQPVDPAALSDILWATMHGIVALAIQMPMFDEARTSRLAALLREMIYKAFHR